MQGASAAASIIAALEQIAADEEMWDGVVIIRGGGATSDLAAFESYELAANIAQFPLPVIIGIGHERDITVLDSVANMRVKTPTAAAEWLIARGDEALATLHRLGSEIYMLASDLLAGNREQIARIGAALPHLPDMALRNARTRLDRLAVAVSDAASTCLRPEMSRLDVMAERLTASAAGHSRARLLHNPRQRPRRHLGRRHPSRRHHPHHPRLGLNRVKSLTDASLTKKKLLTRVLLHHPFRRDNAIIGAWMRLNR